MTAQPLGRNSGAWQELRRRVLDRDGNRCTVCGSSENLQADHVVERQDGGTDDIWNLTTLCGTHHRQKTSAMRKQRAKSKKSGVSMAPPRLPARLAETHSLKAEAPTSDTAAPFSKRPRKQGGSDPNPYRFPAPHPDAIGSHGDAAVKWIEARMKSDAGTPAKRLRHWQWLVLQRGLEFRADGSWCWPVLFASVSRQLGKTELLCELSSWRCSNPQLFGGRPQEVGHSSHNVTLSRRVQSTRWPWAESNGLEVRRMTGDTSIEWPDGSVWRTLSPDNFYGRSMDLLMADEAWAWTEGDFWTGAWPTSAARPMAQAWLFSTAHEEPRSLVPTLLGNDQVASMVWQAPPGADPTDRAVWRAASAHWDAQRERVMEMSQDRPSFATQFLNQWGENVTATGWMPEDRWLARRDRSLEVPAQPDVAAVDDRPGGLGAAVAYAWHDGERVCVVAEVVDSLQKGWERASRARNVLAGISLTREPKARLLRASGVGSRDLPASLQAMRIAVMEGTIAWDGDDLARSMAALDVVEGRDGLRVLTGAREIAVLKVAAWASRECRQQGEPAVLV